ncbi:hypothetical protein RRG08_062760 [Elysia crispata]|uniref:Uncharacterized protein n=1 Tax=Elysia crispata TaxID=231223 RepID=A0AAE1B3B8_9GAST|nr:hypothetical protein RRG08_062760 [Elysia crispata]
MWRGVSILAETVENEAFGRANKAFSTMKEKGTLCEEGDKFLIACALESRKRQQFSFGAGVFANTHGASLRPSTGAD